MRAGEGSARAGFVRRQYATVAVACLLLVVLFAFLIRTARSSVINEVRAHAMGVAAALAGGIPADAVERVQGTGEGAAPDVALLQGLLARVTGLLPDIRYAYIMRPDAQPGARPTDFVYVVDAPARDANGNGAMDPDERSEAPGTPYDAGEYPAMIEALLRPAADRLIRPDPPYPDLISGYAPIRDGAGRTVGIVGVDITAATVRAKLTGIHVVNVGCGALLIALVVWVARLHFRQQEALRENRELARELAARNGQLSEANRVLARRHEQMQAELRLAQQVQLGFLPREFPRRDRLLFDRFYLTSEILGGDLFDVFAVDHERVGLYMADVAGHGVSAALISGLLKMAVTSLRERAAEGEPETALPGRVLARLNDLLLREIPDCEFITMVYAVLDLRSNTVTVASAGHPPPFIIHRLHGTALAWKLPNGAALGLLPDQAYQAIRQDLGPGDSLVFYTDGLIEAMSEDGEEFGEERALEVVARHAAAAPGDLLQALRDAVDQHRAGAAVSDDFSLLVCSLE